MPLDVQQATAAEGAGVTPFELVEEVRDDPGAGRGGASASRHVRSSPRRASGRAYAFANVKVAKRVASCEQAGRRTSRGRDPVDWIEQVFGIDPDFGSGALEMLIAGAVVLVVVGLVLSRRRATRRDTTVR